MKIKDQIKINFLNKKGAHKNEVGKSKVTLYGWNQLGHYKTKCPPNQKVERKFPYKTKFVLDNSKESDNEEANMCLMANLENDEILICDPCPFGEKWNNNLTIFCITQILFLKNMVC